MALAEFIRREIAARDMSMRQFADFVGVTHPTISRLMTDSTPNISIEVLAKIARATHTDIGALARLAAPDAALSQTPNAAILAERISRLPPQQRHMIDAFILGLARADNRDDEREQLRGTATVASIVLVHTDALSAAQLQAVGYASLAELHAKIGHRRAWLYTFTQVRPVRRWGLR